MPLSRPTVRNSSIRFAATPADSCSFTQALHEMFAAIFSTSAFKSVHLCYVSPLSRFFCCFPFVHFFVIFEFPLLSCVGNCGHGSSRAGPADQFGGGGSVCGGAGQEASPRRLGVRTSESSLLLSTRGHDPAHSHHQLPASGCSAYAHTR